MDLDIDLSVGTLSIKNDGVVERIRKTSTQRKFVDQPGMMLIRVSINLYRGFRIYL